MMLVACGGDKQASNETIEKTGEESALAVDKTEPPVVAKEKKSDSNTPTTSTGEKLVKEHCSSCHQAEIYTRAESTIKSAEALLTRVKACDANIGTALFDEDMEAIASYLENSFYKFAK